MHDTKPWYLSAGVWGAVVAALASVLSLFKVQLDPRLLDDLRDWMLSVATLVASAVALYGRVRASRRITLAPAPAPAQRQPSGPAGNARRAPETSDWRMNAALLLALLLLSPSGGCQALRNTVGQTPAAAYVAADRATFEAVAPEYATYVASDARLDEEERARRERTVQTWRIRIESAEGGKGRSDEATERGNRSDEATERRSDEGEEDSVDGSIDRPTDGTDE